MAMSANNIVRGLALLLALCGAIVSVQAEESRNGLNVSIPNGYASLSVDDLAVQSTAGPVRWIRQWDGHEWKFNPHWESLSQSWSNLTGSQSADTGSGSAGAAPPAALASGGGGGGSGCWVWVDENWQPSAGTAVIGGVPQAGPMLAVRTTPFNRLMGEASEDYAPPQQVSVDYASLCAGSSGFAGGATVRDTEGIRKINELYLGDQGRYAFNNRTMLEKRMVRRQPAAASAALYAALASGQVALAPVSVKGYRWMDKAGDWVEYDVQGQVTAWGDRNDNTVWLLRDSGGVLRGVADGNGRAVYSLHYTGELITEVRDYPAGAVGLQGRSVKYGYDANNRLNKVTDARGNITQYDYDATNHIVKITDVEGRVEQLAYSGDMVKQRTAPDGGVTDSVFEYEDSSKQFVSQITHPETESGRRIEQYIHNRAGKLVRLTVNGRVDAEVRYDTGARAETSTNARGYATRTVRNEFDQVVEVTHPDGGVQKRSFSAAHLQVTEETDELGVKKLYQYDAAGNLVKLTEAAGTADERVTEYERNVLGQVRQYTRKGRTESNGTVTPDATWQLEYDALGQLSKTTDPEGHVRRYLYDHAGNLTRYTDPRGNLTQYEVDAAGNLLKMTDALSRVRSYEYDKAGNLVKWTDARAKVAQAAYDAMNRHLQTTNPVGGIAKKRYNAQGLPVGETDADGRSNSAEFDNFMRVTREVDGLGNTTEYKYTVPDGSEAGALGALYEPTEVKYPTFTERQRYDRRERPTSDTLLNTSAQGTEGLLSSQTYDLRGQLKSETDANGKTTFYTYNAFGQVSELKDSLGNVTKALHDARGNLIQVTDAKGNVNKFEFDRNNRLVKDIMPMGQASATGYDEAGNVASRSDALGNTSAYTYDAANRPIEVKQSKGGAAVRSTTFSWDEEDNLTAWTDTDSSRNQTSSAVVSYDDAGRKTGETVTYPAGNKLSYTYTYSKAGYKTGLTWADGSAIGYGYSAHGELETVTIPGEGSISVSQFKWLAPAKVTLPGGATQEKSYDGLLNLEAIKVKTPGQQTLLNVANIYGKEQELKSSNRTDSAAAGSSTRNSVYTYDDEIRLTAVSTDSGGVFGTDTETYTLDAVGNRIAHSKVPGAWTYDANNRLLQRGTGANATTYEYDDAGNLVKQSGAGVVMQFAYDARNRLAEVKNGAGQLVARYGYDPLDRRIWREQFRGRDGSALAQARQTYYLYADEGLIAEASRDITLNGDLSVTAAGSHVLTAQYGPRPNAEFTTGVLFAKLRNSNGADSVAYYHHDHLGTPVQATDKAGNLVWAANYDAFGRATVTTPGATAERPVVDSALRLAGQTEDPETGWHYNYRRYYDPSTGRYVTKDPIGIEGGLNQYRYADANPVNLTDATGECPMCVGYAICVAQCMLEDAAANAITGECNNVGDSAKQCAMSCVLGPLGRLGKWAKRAKDASKCGGGKNSFDGATLVHVRPAGGKAADAALAKSELKPISALRAGDEVLSLAEWKAEAGIAPSGAHLSYEKITDVFSSIKEQVFIHIAFADGSTLTATEGHPFKTVDGWRDAALLAAGDRVLAPATLRGGAQQGTQTVAGVRRELKIARAYNLEVANNHTFLVGPEGAVAHNGFGSYTCTFANGMKYHGKGDYSRAQKSAADHAKANKTTTTNIDWKPAKNDHDSFVDEAKRIRGDGGIGKGQTNNYNMINSPGEKHLP